MGRNSFYGVYGFNGAGVYTDWDCVLKSKKYIAGFKVKKFPCISMAKEFIDEGMQNVYKAIAQDKSILPKKVNLNWFYRME